MYRTTVLIPNYNGIKYIEACLDSLLKCGDVPIVIVDNGSADGSAELIAEEYPEVRLIRLEKNTGFCHAVNVGLHEVKTDFVFLLNNDTTVDQDCIKVLEKRMDSDKRLFAAQAKILNMYNPGLIDDCGDLYSALGWAYARGKDKSADGFEKASYCFACCGAAVMYRMSVLSYIGEFDENHFAYLEDIDLGYRARIYGFSNIFDPQALVYHAGSATSGSRHNKFKVDLSARNSIYLIYKNMPFLQWLINLPLLIIGFAVKTLFFILKGMGGTYVKGLFKGIKLCAEDAQTVPGHKVKFKWKRIITYVIIQFELWVNIFRRF